MLTFTRSHMSGFIWEEIMLQKPARPSLTIGISLKKNV